MISLLDSIRSQPTVLERLAREWPRAAVSLPEFRPPYIFTGMGSSLFAAYPAWLRMANVGIDARLWETAELLHYGIGAIPSQATVVLVSQSGGTAEVLALRERLGAGQRVVAVTNEPESALGRAAHHVVLLGCPSQTLASTVTYTATLFLLEALAHAFSGADPASWLEDVAAVAALMPAYLDQLSASPLPASGAAGRVVFLARGPSLASAQQSALMFKEVGRQGGEALSAAAFRHGPLEMAGPGLQAVLFVPQGATTPALLRLARDIENFGGRVYLIADQRVAPSGRGHPPVAEAVAPFLNILPIQLAAVKMAEAQGREPGVFRQASSVTTTE